MKYFFVFLVSLVVGLAILLSLEYIHGRFLLVIGFQWVTQFILPWVILLLLIIIARKQVSNIDN